MKKKFFAVALATTMALSTAMTASAETLTGTAWWTGMQAGQDYALKDGKVTLEVKTSSDAAAFSVEVYNAGTDAAGDGYYMTTGSDGNGWFAEKLTGTVSNPFADNNGADPGKFVAGNTYEVTVTISGSEYKMEYYDATAGALIYTMTGTTDATDVPAASDFKVHVMAQIGTFDVSEKVVTSTPESETKAPESETKAPESETKAPATTPKTGDAAPVVALAAVAVLASAAVVVSRKKVTE